MYRNKSFKVLGFLILFTCLLSITYGLKVISPYGISSSSSIISTLNETDPYYFSNPMGYYNLTTLPPYPTPENTSWNESRGTALFPPIILINNVSSIGNWTRDKSSLPNLSYTQIVSSIGNWSLDKTSLPNLSYTQIVSSIGNWSLDKSNYNTTNELSTIFISNNSDISINNLSINNNFTIRNIRQEDKQPNYYEPIFCDFESMSSGGCPPFIFTAISSGTAGTGSGTSDNIGVGTMLDSTTANGGYMMYVNTNSYLLSGGEHFRIYFKDSDTITNGQNVSKFKFGFHDSTTSANPTDGCYFESTLNNLTAVCANNSVYNTSVPYIISDNIWYDAQIDVINITYVNFTLYNSTGSLLWNTSITTKIPYQVGRETGLCVLATENATTNGRALISLDYLSVWIDRKLSRGRD